MLQQVPGALARLGVRTPGQTCPDIHQPTFVVDERCIAVGLKVLAEVATTGPTPETADARQNFLGLTRYPQGDPWPGHRH